MSECGAPAIISVLLQKKSKFVVSAKVSFVLLCAFSLLALNIHTSRQAGTRSHTHTHVDLSSPVWHNCWLGYFLYQVYIFFFFLKVSRLSAGFTLQTEHWHLALHRGSSLKRKKNTQNFKIRDWTTVKNRDERWGVEEQNSPQSFHMMRSNIPMFHRDFFNDKVSPRRRTVSLEALTYGP